MPQSRNGPVTLDFRPFGGAGIEIVRDRVALEHLRDLAVEQFGDMVKAVVDVTRGVMAIGGAMHADEEHDGSRQSDLWGINLYPDEHGADSWIEFDSMINIRPAQGNRSRGVDDRSVQAAIRRVVDALLLGDD